MLGTFRLWYSSRTTQSPNCNAQSYLIVPWRTLRPRFVGILICRFLISENSFSLRILEFVPDCEEPSSTSFAEVFHPLQTQKRERIKYDNNQLRELEAAFAINQYPSATERDQLAAKTGVTESRIQVLIGKPICSVYFIRIKFKRKSAAEVQA